MSDKVGVFEDEETIIIDIGEDRIIYVSQSHIKKWIGHALTLDPKGKVCFVKKKLDHVTHVLYEQRLYPLEFVGQYWVYGTPDIERLFFCYLNSRPMITRKEYDLEQIRLQNVPDFNNLSFVEPIEELECVDVVDSDQSNGRVIYYYYTIYAGKVFVVMEREDEEQKDVYVPLQWKKEVPTPWGDRYLSCQWGCPKRPEWMSQPEELVQRVQASVTKLENHQSEVSYVDAHYSVWSESHHGYIADDIVSQISKNELVAHGDGHGLFANRGVASYTKVIYPYTHEAVQQADMNEYLLSNGDNRVHCFIYVSAFLSQNSIAAVKEQKMRYVEVDDRPVFAVPGAKMSSTESVRLRSEYFDRMERYLYSKNVLSAKIEETQTGKYASRNKRLLAKEGDYPLVEKWTDLWKYETVSFYYAVTGRVQQGISYVDEGPLYTRTVYRIRGDLADFDQDRIRQCVVPIVRKGKKMLEIRNYITFTMSTPGVREWEYTPGPYDPDFSAYLRSERRRGNLNSVKLIYGVWYGFRINNKPIDYMREVWDKAKDVIDEPFTMEMLRRTLRDRDVYFSKAEFVKYFSYFCTNKWVENIGRKGQYRRAVGESVIETG